MVITDRVAVIKCFGSNSLLALTGILSAFILLLSCQSVTPVFSESLIIFESQRVGNIDIYLLNLATGEERRLTNSPANDVQPSWSPDGRQIVFVSYRDGNGEIYVMDRDGRNQRNLTNNPANDLEPCWSPNGSQIAFTSGRGGNLEIYVMNADGINPRNLTNHRSHDSQPSWSPDGKQIAFSSWQDGISMDIYIINADGTNVRNLTNYPSEDRYPSWSPDGRKIVFRRWDGHGGQPKLFVLKIENGKMKRLPVSFKLPENPSWTPDSKKILFNNNSPESQLYIVDIETGKTKTVVDKLMLGFNAHPHWFESKARPIQQVRRDPASGPVLKHKSLLSGK